MKADLLTILVWLTYMVVSAAAGAVLVYLFISVVFLGGGSACPQNLCQ